MKELLLFRSRKIELTIESVGRIIDQITLGFDDLTLGLHEVIRNIIKPTHAKFPLWLKRDLERIFDLGCTCRITRDVCESRLLTFAYKFCDSRCFPNERHV